MVSMDWENGYVECSAMFNSNISAVFRALLHQARCDIYVISTLYLHTIYILSTGRVWSHYCRGAWSLTALRTPLITGTPGDWDPT